MADGSDGIAPRMDGVRPPRRVSKADVPRLGDQIKEVWKVDGQQRPAGERAVHISVLIVYLGFGTVIWESSGSAPLRVFGLAAVLIVLVCIATPVLLRLRFRS
jgi:hypothetical protein